MKLVYFIFLNILLLQVCSYSQLKEEKVFRYRNTSVGSDVNTFFKTGLKYYSAPARFDGEDWIIAGSVLTVTGLAMFVDDDVRNFWKKNQNESVNDILQVGNVYGSFLFASAFSGSVYLSGKIFKNPELAATGRMLIEGIVYSNITNASIKFVAGRSRPYLDQGPYFFKPFQTNNDNISFPSGHSNMAFTLSTILSQRIDNVFATIALYTLAATSFVQRMYVDHHWLSDCLLGASIGYFTGRAVVSFDREIESKKFSFMPFYRNKSLGINAVYMF